MWAHILFLAKTIMNLHCVRMRSTLWRHHTLLAHKYITVNRPMREEQVGEKDMIPSPHNNPFNFFFLYFLGFSIPFKATLRRPFEEAFLPFSDFVHVEWPPPGNGLGRWQCGQDWKNHSRGDKSIRQQAWHPQRGLLCPGKSERKKVLPVTFFSE